MVRATPATFQTTNIADKTAWYFPDLKHRRLTARLPTPTKAMASDKGINTAFTLVSVSDSPFILHLDVIGLTILFSNATNHPSGIGSMGTPSVPIPTATVERQSDFPLKFNKVQKL
eukprot:TRINITY_DN23342_c0_g1_i1.p2 TRINITY_DN23342_c0_g1~~TRINITY_DN23342_c0_g1_i1.p2  ORF type:complete len:116 (-),score=5.40 TRINITY_DN23342_c0_g1_i1:4-351(-)